MNFSKILNVLLLPESTYRKLTNKRWTLAVGIIFMGVVDLLFPFLSGRYSAFFSGDTRVVTANILISVIFLLLLGFVDVLFFSTPLYDFVRVFFKKEAAGQENNGSLVKVAKIYILAQLVTLPLFLIVNYVFGRNINSDLFILAGVILEMVLIVWASAIVSRGVGSVYRLAPIHRQLVFISVFAWNYILGYALMFILRNWTILLLK